MNKVFGVSTTNNEGGTDFYAVVASDHDEAAAIVSDQLDKDESALVVEPLDLMLSAQFRGFAMLGGML